MAVYSYNVVKNKVFRLFVCLHMLQNTHDRVLALLHVFLAFLWRISCQLEIVDDTILNSQFIFYPREDIFIDRFQRQVKIFDLIAIYKTSSSCGHATPEAPIVAHATPNFCKLFKEAFLNRTWAVVERLNNFGHAASKIGNYSSITP